MTPIDYRQNQIYPLYAFANYYPVLSVGYILGQVPSNMIIGYVRPSLYLCCMAMVWSGVSAATCGVTNYQGLVAVRFFLGVVEAPLFPGVSQYLIYEVSRNLQALSDGVNAGHQSTIQPPPPTP